MKSITEIFFSLFSIVEDLNEVIVSNVITNNVDLGIYFVEIASTKKAAMILLFFIKIPSTVLFKMLVRNTEFAPSKF